LRIVWYQNWPLATKMREINLFLGDPFLPLRSTEIENFKRRYLRCLKRARNGLELTILKSQWVRLNGHNFGTR